MVGRSDIAPDRASHEPGSQCYPSAQVTGGKNVEGDQDGSFGWTCLRLGRDMIPRMKSCHAGNP